MASGFPVTASACAQRQADWILQPCSHQVTAWHWIWAATTRETWSWDSEMTQPQGKAWVGWLAAIVQHSRINEEQWRQALYHSSQPDTESSRGPTQLHNKACGEFGGRDPCVGPRGPALEVASEQSKGNNHRRLHRQHVTDRLDLRLQLSRAKSWHGPASLQHCLHLCQASQCWERGKHTLKENRASWCPQGFCSSNLGSDLAPVGVVAGPEKRESPASHLTPVLAIHPSPSPYQGDSGQHTLRKDVTCFPATSSAPNTEHLQLIQGCTRQEHPFKTAVGSWFT